MDEMARNTMTGSSPTPAKSASRVRQATNVSLSADLVDQARDLHIDISKACDRGLALAIAEEKSRRWLAENQAALQSSNDFVMQHGLPLARYRRF
jgi:antitoxin CcdA